jgi:hypothetical protein
MFFRTPFPALSDSNPHEYWTKHQFGACAGPFPSGSFFDAASAFSFLSLFALYAASSLPDKNDTVGTTDTDEKKYFSEASRGP